MPLTVIQQKPWYKDGLRFKCTGCGGCCTGSPGVVWVTAQEVQQMAEHLNLSIDEFSEKYLRLLGNRISLKEHAYTYDCVFLKEGKRCSIYAHRPTQCRTFPWWPSNISSEREWLEAASWCEGINHPEAPIIPYEEIQAQRELEESLENDRSRFG